MPRVFKKKGLSIESSKREDGERGGPSLHSELEKKRAYLKACIAVFTASICFAMASFSECKVSMRDSCSSMSPWRSVSSRSAVFRCSCALPLDAATSGAVTLGDVVWGGAVAADVLSL